MQFLFDQKTVRVGNFETHPFPNEKGEGSGHALAFHVVVFVKGDFLIVVGKTKLRKHRGSFRCDKKDARKKGDELKPQRIHSLQDIKELATDKSFWVRVDLEQVAQVNVAVGLDHFMGWVRKNSRIGERVHGGPVKTVQT